MVRLEIKPRPSSESGSNSYQIPRMPAVAAVALPAPAAMLLLLQQLMALESLQPVIATTTAKARLVTGKRKEEDWKRMHM
jgi:hypothetical protein